MTAQFANHGGVDTIKILLVGGTSHETARVQKVLDKSCLGKCKVIQCSNLVDAIPLLEMGEIKVVLLALFDGMDAPDSLAKINQHAPTIPVVVLSHGSGNEQWEKMPKDSLHGYLDSPSLTPEAIESALRTAFSIRELKRELKESRMRENHEKRMRLLERLSGAPQTAITTNSRGGEPLKESNFERFTALSRQYGEVLEMALAKNAPARVISDGIRAISEELGAIKAGPNDLLDIHGHALRLKSCGVSENQADICAEESRLMLIEAMGYLTSYYRNYSSYALSIINTVSSSETGRASKRTTATVRAAR